MAKLPPVERFSTGGFTCSEVKQGHKSLMERLGIVSRPVYCRLIGEDLMVGFVKAPPRPEIGSTITGIDVILDAQKELIRRQVILRSIVISSEGLADLENKLRPMILDQILDAQRKTTVEAPGDE